MSAGGLPLYGMCTMSMCASDFSNSPARCCDEPVPEDWQRHLRHVITNVVGGPEIGVKVEARALVIQAGDRVLLCSDGLTEMLKGDAIMAVLEAEPLPEKAATALVAQANDAGGRDNITVLIARFDPQK